VRIILLGTGGFHPSERRHTACVFVPELNLMLDAGTATYRVQPLLTGGELDVFLTHGHLDHICGLTYLLTPLTLRQVQHVRVHAQQHVLEAVRSHLFAPVVFPVLPKYEWVTLSGQHTTICGRVKLSWQVLPSHPGASLGFRLDWTENGRPRSFAYITDTVVDGTYTDFIRDVDVLVHECYFRDAQADFAKVTGHSHTTPVLELARECGAKRLVLTHLDPQSVQNDPIELAKHISLFPNTTIADDRLEIDV
jgi:ribonuclease Z